jgi:hypothetical protein
MYILRKTMLRLSVAMLCSVHAICVASTLAGILKLVGEVYELMLLLTVLHVAVCTSTLLTSDHA